jgi:hypothetical protein
MIDLTGLGLTTDLVSATVVTFNVGLIVDLMLTFGTTCDLTIRELYYLSANLSALIRSGTGRSK